MPLSYDDLSNKLSVEIGIGKGLRDNNNLLHELLDDRDELIEQLVIENAKLKRRELN
jgi:hypothetical protein